MSVVGPRPPLPEEVAEYDEWAMQRLGYIARRSVSMDLKIILQTIAVVFTGKGAA